MANSMTADVHKATMWSIVLSVLMIAAGVVAIGVPVIAGVTVTAIIGWLLVLSGLLHVAFAWRARRAGAVVWEVLAGNCLRRHRFYLLASPVAGLALLTLAIAMYLLIEGVLEIRPVVPTPSCTGERMAAGRRRHYPSCLPC